MAKKTTLGTAILTASAFFIGACSPQETDNNNNYRDPYVQSDPKSSSSTQQQVIIDHPVPPGFKLLSETVQYYNPDDQEYYKASAYTRNGDYLCVSSGDYTNDSMYFKSENGKLYLTESKDKFSAKQRDSDDAYLYASPCNGSAAWDVDDPTNNYKARSMNFSKKECDDFNKKYDLKPDAGKTAPCLGN